MHYYVLTWRTAVDLSADKPDPNVVIEDHDMNTWGIVQVGTGFDNRFDDTTGFALYKTKVDIAADGNNKVICFKDITANKIEIYMNGEQKYKGEGKWGRKVEIPVSGDISGEIELAVIIESTDVADKAGITKGVVIINKAN